MDNPKISISNNRFGKCVLATAEIKQGEGVCEFDGPFYSAKKCTDLPKDIADHAIQCGDTNWRDSVGLARYTNHSCMPNCGIRGLYTLVAMRDIKPGHEITWDYDMTEDSDWQMPCLCGVPNCRKIIGSFGKLPDAVRQKYHGYISIWLVRKYRL